MIGYLKRLLTTGFAYQLGEIVSKSLAIFLLPLYTRHYSPGDLGMAEQLVTTVILVSIAVRIGVGEALVRFHFFDEDDQRRRLIARTATATVLITTTVVAIAGALAAVPLSKALFGTPHPAEFRAAALGLWAFTNLEIVYALLRAQGRLKLYAFASLTNVALTIGLTVWLVVFREEGALGILLGNYVASAFVLFVMLVVLRDAIGVLAPRSIHTGYLRAMLKFGFPTVPAEMSVFALFFVDRLWLYRFDSPKSAGLYTLAIKIAAVVILVVRAFQHAWPPLAYSIDEDEEASAVYARITTYYVVFCGLVVAAMTLFSRWIVQVIAGPAFESAYHAVPWLVLGWALYGLFLVLVAVAGRAQVTVRNFPAAACGLIANIGLLALLVEPLGAVGAGIALCGACAVMLVAMHLFTRKLFHVPFEWGRLALFLGVVVPIVVAAEMMLPTTGVTGFVSRAVVLATLPLLLIAVRFFRPGEVQAAQSAVKSLRGRVATAASRG